MHARLFEALPTDGVAIVSGDSPWPQRKAGQYPCDLLWVGCRPECDLVAEPVPCRDGRLAFLCDGQRFELLHCDHDDLASVLAVVGVGKVLGIPARDMRDMLRQPVTGLPQVPTEKKTKHWKSHRPRQLCGKMTQPSLLGWSDMLADQAISGSIASASASR